MHNSSTKTPPLVVGLLLALLSLAACAGPSVVPLQVDLPYYDKETFISSASLIVEGEVVAVDYRVQKPRYLPSGATPEENPWLGIPGEESQKVIDEAPGVPVTDITVHLTAVHKGAAKPGQEITIVQTGGIVDGIKYQVEGNQDPILGDTYLYFAIDSFDGAFAPLSESGGIFHATSKSTEQNGSFAATNAGVSPFETLTSDEVARLVAG